MTAGWDEQRARDLRRDPEPVEAAGWFAVPQTLVTRAKARELREQAAVGGYDVLDFSATELLSVSAADELVCKGEWTATTGESEYVRGVVEKVQQRRAAAAHPEAPDG